MAGYKVGSGRIVITNNLALWHNQTVGCFDHAYLWFYFTRAAETLWLVRNDEAPSLWRQLWDFIPFAIVAFGVALGAWLWRNGLPFGPVRYLPPGTGRAFIEHLRANGELLWRTGQCAQVVTQLRHALLVQLCQRVPQLRQYDSARQLELICQLSKLPPALIQAGLFDPYIHSAQAFTRTMAQLNLIRKAL